MEGVGERSIVTAMSWLSSLTDVAKNAEALLNSVDAKAKEVAVVTNQVGALPNQAAEVGSETTRSGGVGAGRPYAKHETRNMASASEGGVGERSEVPADRPAGRGGAPRTPRTKKSLSSGSSLANGHAKAKAKAVAVEEKSFDDLAAALSLSSEDRNAKDTSPARDPRLLSPVNKAGVTAPKAGEEVQEVKPNAFPPPPRPRPWTRRRRSLSRCFRILPPSFWIVPPRWPEGRRRSWRPRRLKRTGPKPLRRRRRRRPWPRR